MHPHKSAVLHPTKERRPTVGGTRHPARIPAKRGRLTTFACRPLRATRRSWHSLQWATIAFKPHVTARTIVHHTKTCFIASQMQIHNGDPLLRCHALRKVFQQRPRNLDGFLNRMQLFPMSNFPCALRPIAP